MRRIVRFGAAKVKGVVSARRGGVALAAGFVVFAATALDDIEANARATYSVRWILVHLVEEYARHCGHADLLRQAIDGATGD